MLKISKYIYIHFSTVFLFIVCYFNRNLDILAVSYFSIFLHELAHLIAALCIGLKTSRIVLYAFGANLKLKNTLVYCFSDEIILYLSGPLINALMAIFSIFFIKNGKLWEIFYWNNLMLFLFNLLPIGPMDSGILFKKILARKIGYSLAESIIRIISIIMISGLVIFEIILIKISQFNFSIIFICVFLIGNIITNKEKYQIDLIKEMMYYKQKDNFKIKKVKNILIKNDVNYKDLVKKFSEGYSYVIFKENSSGKISEILTEKEIVEQILNN